MRKIILLSLLLVMCFSGIAQIPQGINYQAVAFNSSGIPIANANIQVKIGILSDTLTPVIVWEELHSTVKTNAGGIFNLVIGMGAKQSGSASAFNNVDWSKTPLYLKIQIYYQGAWKYLGSAELWSVPYAMTAGDLGGPVKKLSVVGGTTSPEEPLFEVKNKDGQTVFAVYNEGVRIYVDDVAKGAKGGFAVGGFGEAKTPSQSLLFISPDSIRAYIRTDPAKGAKGGFAVGGFGEAKASSRELLFVSADSIRAYIDTKTGKGAKGGFAVGGFDNAKGAQDNFMLINPDSTRFYVRELSPGLSSSFNIIGINLDQTRTSLLSANTDTVGIAGVLNVQNNMKVSGNIDYTGTVNSIVPTLVTLEPFNITDTTAMVNCDIISNGGAAVIVSGICWSTSPNPTEKLTTKTTNGTLLGQYTGVMKGLSATTTYYVRAYATNANGTGYGSEISFTTTATGATIADFDGNIYNVVVIGTQAWMASNLKTTSYNDGSSIPNVADDAAWMALATPGYAWYNNDAATFADYGILYNWATVNTGMLCPTGWHVPTDAEWTTLSTYLGGSLVAGGKLKESGTTHWLDPNTDATNETGFTALPGGARGYMGPFLDLGTKGNWWTSTMISVDPASVMMFSGTGEMMVSQSMAGLGQSVRCTLNAKK